MSLWQRPHWAEGIENTSLFLRLGLPSTLIRHGNETFLKRSSNRHSKNLKTPAIHWCVDGKHFENDAFWNRWRHDMVNKWFPWPKFALTQIQSDRWLLRCQITPVWTEKDLGVFSVKPPFWNFFGVELMEPEHGRFGGVRAPKRSPIPM